MCYGLQPEIKLSYLTLLKVYDAYFKEKLYYG